MFKNDGNYGLDDMVAIVTGAGAGIGRASAILLAKAGVKVVCTDLSKEMADETINEIIKLGGEGIGLKCDVTKEEDLKNIVDEAVKKYEKINILVNNAGGGSAGREFFKELSLEYIQKIYMLNVFSVFVLSKLCAPHMNESGYGAIVNISSMSGQMQSHNMSVYGSSKASVNQLTKYMAVDLGPNIRVNAVAPGAIKTAALAKVLTPEIEKVMLKRTPLKKLGEAEDIAMAVLFLASPFAKWISGQILPVNGGGEQDLDQ